MISVGSCGLRRPELRAGEVFPVSVATDARDMFARSLRGVLAKEGRSVLLKPRCPNHVRGGVLTTKDIMLVEEPVRQRVVRRRGERGNAADGELHFCQRASAWLCWAP